MTLSTATRLADDEKLEVLRRLDQFRQWHSLDEKRYCLVCGTLISGRQIQVTGGTRGNGPLRLSCPTERCNSIPMDWVLPTDEILAKVEKMAAEERKAAELKPVAVTIGNGKTVPTAKPHEDLISRLLKFVLPFKRVRRVTLLALIPPSLGDWPENIDCPRGRCCFADPPRGFRAGGKRLLDVEYFQPCTFK